MNPSLAHEHGLDPNCSGSCPAERQTLSILIKGVKLISRYVLLIRGRGAGEEPEEVLLRDLPLLAAIVAWAAACTAILLTTS